MREPDTPRLRELALVSRELGALCFDGFRRELERARIGLEEWTVRLTREPTRTLRSAPALEQHAGWEDGTRRVGWCLGVLAAAGGADCLMGRREARGLQWMVEAIVRPLGLALHPRGDELPSSLRGETAWEVPLLGAWCVLQAASGGAGALRWSGRHDASGGCLALETRAASAELEARVARLTSPSGRVRSAVAPCRLVLSWS